MQKRSAASLYGHRDPLAAMTLRARAAAHDADGLVRRRQLPRAQATQSVLRRRATDLDGGRRNTRRVVRAAARARALLWLDGPSVIASSMHTHLLATTVWRLPQGQPVEALLRRVATEELVLVSTGASDWLDSNGAAEPVESGRRVTGRKSFCSGAPAGNLLITSAHCEDPRDGRRVLHFPVPLRDAAVTILGNWRATGMRATGSTDVLLEGVFVPESAVSLRRPKGHWHPFYNVVVVVVLPSVMSVYLGVAEAAHDLALQQLQRKRHDADAWYLVGEMENSLATGQMVVREMIGLCSDYSFAADLATANAVLTRKTIAAQSLLAAVEKALEAFGGGGASATWAWSDSAHVGHHASRWLRWALVEAAQRVRDPVLLQNFGASNGSGPERSAPWLPRCGASFWQSLGWTDRPSPNWRAQQVFELPILATFTP